MPSDKAADSSQKGNKGSVALVPIAWEMASQHNGGFTPGKACQGSDNVTGIADNEDSRTSVEGNESVEAAFAHIPLGTTEVILERMGLVAQAEAR